MSLRFKSMADLNANLAGGLSAAGAKRGKYGNHHVEYDGRKFDSKLEMKRYIDLERLKQAKLIRGFAHQVSVPLPSGKRRMIIDFMIVENDGRIRWEDAKGMPTKDWLVKRDELQHALGIEIKCV